MSIAIVSETSIFGGNNAVSARVWNYAKSLRMAGVRVLLLSYRDYCRGRELREVEKSIFAYGTDAANPSITHFFEDLSALVVSEQIRSILFYPTPNPVFELRFLLWKRRVNFNNVFCEINEVRRFEKSYSSTFSFPKRVLYNIVTKQTEGLTKYYKGLICISNTIRQYFQKYNSNSIVIPILSDIPDHIPQKIKPEDNRLTRFVFTGTVAVEKENMMELLKGFCLFNSVYEDWELLIYGSGPEDNYKLIESLIIYYNLSEKIKLMGEVDHSCIMSVLSDADCLILPRRNTQQNYYGFSTKLSEYAVSGTPIILTDTGVIFDYFNDGVDCLKVKGYDADGFFDQLNRFVSLSQEKRDEIALNAFLTAKKSFDWRLYSTPLLDFIFQ